MLLTVSVTGRPQFGEATVVDSEEQERLPIIFKQASNEK